jgi:alpha-glucosidase (family GH31 glycosyl hydrolase)
MVDPRRGRVPFRFLGRASAVSRRGSTVEVGADNVRLELTFCTPRVVRVRLDPEGAQAGLSYVAPRAWPDTHVQVEDGEAPRVATGELSIDVTTRPLRLAFADPRRGVMLWEPASGGMGIEPAGDGSGRRRVTARFQFAGEQHFYGLGHGGPGLDRLGTTRRLWNTHIGHGPGTDIPIPLLVSNLGYGLFFDNTSDAALSVGRSDDGVQLVYTAERGPLDWYFLLGENLRGLMREVAELLGRAPLPPRWALGYLQSTRHFEDTAELRRLPRTIREKRIPCDALIFLSTYGDALGWNRGVGHLEFQPELWADPAGLLGEIREQHFEMITHEYPVLHPEASPHEEAVANGYLLAEGYERAPKTERPSANYREGQRYVDFTNPDARAWWWAEHRDLRELGVAGWWLDGGEGPPATAQLVGGDGTVVHNIYDRFRHRGFAEGEAADRPDRRVFLLCRSGAAGMQQFGASTWTGDINNDFATLEAQVPLGLNTGLSGVPYWGTDIGGFFHPIPETGELYARWFQLGAFSPIFRSHGWVWREHVPWAHGPEIEAICRRYAELRYRLLPYTYTLAWQAHARGLPLMRPLVLNYPDDPRVWGLGTQYLWGDDLLVAPVTREGATSWPVYLPAGGWYDFWTGHLFDGPVGASVEAPLDRLPLFVRAGAIIPLGPLMQHTGERPLDEVTLRIYPEGASRFELYEDDGRSNAYRDGHHALTRFECTADGDGVIVRIHEPDGDRSVMPPDRSYVLQVRADRPARVSLDGVGELPGLDDANHQGPGWWDDGQGFTWVRLRRQLAATVRLDR